MNDLKPTVTIEKGIPRKHQARGLLTALRRVVADLEVGDSFVIHYPTWTPYQRDQYRGPVTGEKAKRAVDAFNNRGGGGVKLSFRSINDESGRIWRRK